MGKNYPSGLLIVSVKNKKPKTNRFLFLPTISVLASFWIAISVFRWKILVFGFLNRLWATLHYFVCQLNNFISPYFHFPLLYRNLSHCLYNWGHWEKGWKRKTQSTKIWIRHPHQCRKANPFSICFSCQYPHWPN